jgi:hypothetical protein
MNLDHLTYRSHRRRDGKWECVCPQLDNCRSVHADRAEAISRCVREAFARFAEIDAERRIQQMSNR